jgi:hypothetical protein
MQGKVTMRTMVCYHCGRDRLTIAMAPWDALVAICRGCKEMVPIDQTDAIATTEAEAASRGLPGKRGSNCSSESAGEGKPGLQQEPMQPPTLPNAADPAPSSEPAAPVAPLAEPPGQEQASERPARRRPNRNVA